MGNTHSVQVSHLQALEKLVVVEKKKYSMSKYFFWIFFLLLKPFIFLPIVLLNAADT